MIPAILQSVPSNMIDAQAIADLVKVATAHQSTDSAEAWVRTVSIIGAILVGLFGFIRKVGSASDAALTTAVSVKDLATKVGDSIAASTETRANVISELRNHDERMMSGFDDLFDAWKEGRERKKPAIGRSERSRTRERRR